MKQNSVRTWGAWNEVNGKVGEKLWKTTPKQRVKWRSSSSRWTPLGCNTHVHTSKSIIWNIHSFCPPTQGLFLLRTSHHGGLLLSKSTLSRMLKSSAMGLRDEGDATHRLWIGKLVEGSRGCVHGDECWLDGSWASLACTVYQLIKRKAWWHAATAKIIWPAVKQESTTQADR